MKKLMSLMLVTTILLLAGCGANKQIDADTPKVKTDDEMIANQEKFLHSGESYTPELFVDFANTYDGILDGEGQQAYVFDLRDTEEYNNGHIIGSVNIEFDPKDSENIIERIPSDWSVYIIGDEKEAKTMRDSLKKVDEHLFVYIIEGGYEALYEEDGIEPYITNKIGEFKDFTRTQAEEKINTVQ